MNVDADKNTPLLSSGRRMVVLRAVLVGAIVFAAGVGLDWTLLPGRRQLLYSDALTGLVAVWFSFLAMNYYYAQQQAATARLRTIAEVNHHVRNALYQITLSVHVRHDRELITVTEEAARRIDWVLREVLPEDSQRAKPAAEQQEKR